MQRARAPTMLIGGQRATILQQTSGAGVQHGAQNITTTRVLRPVSGQTQQPALPQTPVRMVSFNKLMNCIDFYLPLHIILKKVASC